MMVNELLRMNIIRELVVFNREGNFIRALYHDLGERLLLLVRALMALLTLSHLNETAVDDGRARVLNLPFDARVVI